MLVLLEQEYSFGQNVPVVSDPLSWLSVKFLYGQNINDIALACWIISPITSVVKNQGKTKMIISRISCWILCLIVKGGFLSFQYRNVNMILVKTWASFSHVVFIKLFTNSSFSSSLTTRKFLNKMLLESGSYLHLCNSDHTMNQRALEFPWKVL